MHYSIYFLIISHDKFFYQKSDVRICECCECMNPPLHEPAYHNGACTIFGESMKGLIAKQAEFISQCITNEQLIKRAYTDFLIKTSLTLDQSHKFPLTLFGEMLRFPQIFLKKQPFPPDLRPLIKDCK